MQVVQSGKGFIFAFSYLLKASYLVITINDCYYSENNNKKVCCD